MDTHTALRAGKWSGFICKRASKETIDTIALGLLKKEELEEEERRRMPNCDFLLLTVLA